LTAAVSDLDRPDPDDPPSVRWRKPVLLVNRDSRRGAEQANDARRLLTEAGLRLHAFEPTRGKELSARIRRLQDEGADLVVVGGGDGTLRTAAEAVKDGDATLGVLPLGTGNNFARDLGIPLTLPEACKTMAAGQVARADLGEAELENGRKRIFINAAHVGLFGEANRQLEEDLKRRLGYAAYVYGAWKVCRGFRPFGLIVRTEEAVKQWSVAQASVILGRFYAGGWGEIPGETLSDQRMTLTVFEWDRWLPLARAGLRILRSRSANGAKAHRYPVREVSLRAAPPQDVNLDGEIFGQTPVTFRTLPQAVRVVVGDVFQEAPPLPSGRKAFLIGGASAGILAAGYLWSRRRNGASGEEREG
jgi:YegS/Rv2252/BmrU family lipid kinase